MTQNLISTQELIRLYDISYSTLNYYTNMGLLSVAKRVKNTRFYRQSEVEKRLKEIAHLKDRGYPLNLIKRELSN